jgi:predicted dehydrogenase
MPMNPPLQRKLRMGLVGGGRGFIGRVHAAAACLDNRAVLAAGALSSDPATGRKTAAAFAIPPERAYGSYQEMLAAESRLPPSERIDFVTIATPNHTHYEIARAFAEAGFNVMCDKPMTLTLAQAEELARIVLQSGVVFAVTHNYTGYPSVRQARDMIQSGALGDIQALRASYLQGWLRRPMTAEQKERRAWKLDPSRAGASGCFGDIGIHAYNLSRFVTGILPEEVSCQLKTFEGAGVLDDYGTARIRFENGMLGTITASRISHGRENDLWIEVDGTQGALEWHQEEPNKLWLRVNGQPHRLFTRDPNASFTTATAKASSRLPSGHPEGFIEAFANVYTAAFLDMAKRAAGAPVDPAQSLYPNVADGLDGLNFITRCVASAQQDGAWVSLKHPLV